MEGGIEARAWVLLGPFQFFLRGDAGIGLGYKADPKGLGPPLEPFQFFLRGMLMRSVCEVYGGEVRWEVMHGFKTYLDILPTVQFEVGMKASHQPGVATFPETPSPHIYYFNLLKESTALLSFKATVQLYNCTTIQLCNYTTVQLYNPTIPS